MPRKALKPREKRGIPDPDFKFGSVLASRFIGRVNFMGKKVTAEKIFYGAMDHVKEKTGEDAIWALEDYGFQAIIAPSFADIFKNNCLNIGIVPIIARPELVDQLISKSIDNPSTDIEISVRNKTWSCSMLGIINERFDLNDFSQHRLLNGLDDIGITLTHESDITNFEAKRDSNKPSMA